MGQKKNTFRIRNVMDERKILIVNLAKGKIGEDNCALLGSMLVTWIFLAALSRANIQEQHRTPFYLFVDEFHSFFTLSYVDILSEARKYGLHLILTNQFINQLDERIRDAIFGNVGTIISFRVGADDATYLFKEFSTHFNSSDFTNLPNYEIYLKLMIDGMTSNPFSAMTLPLPKQVFSNDSEVANESRQQYGKSRNEVEHDILLRYQGDAKHESLQKNLF